jgi:DDE superfamily endonuclease
MKQVFFTRTYQFPISPALRLTPTHRMVPDRGLSDRKHSGVKGKKIRLTYALTSNADGSEKLPAFVIGKAARPRAFNKKTGAQLGFYYRNNAKAWMTAHLYQDWIQQWDRELGERKRKILLLQDNFSGHIVPTNLRNIRVVPFEPNLTAHVQPKDQGIIRCFKAHYRTRFIQRAIDHYDEGITPSEIYTINQLQAMRIADAAWRNVDTTTIRNCWRKAGILPEMDSSRTSQPSIPISSLLHDPASETDPVAHAEKQVEAALDDLVATGALQTKNRMDIESLLNPAGESHVLTETSDKEIYQAVMDSIVARENVEINGGDDVNEDDTPIEPRPTRRDVLKAVSTISRYAEDLNYPIARKFEALLGSFNRQIRLEETKSMKETVLTDFFQRS